MEDALHIIPQVVCTLFQRNGAKLLAYGDSLRTGVEKGLLITVMHLPFYLNNQTTLLHTSVEYDCCTVVFSSTEFFLF